MIQVILLRNIFKPQDRIIQSFNDGITVAELKEKLQITQGEFHVRMNGKDLDDSFLLLGDCSLAIFPVIGKGGGGSKNVVGLVAGIALAVFTGGAGAGLLGVLGTTTGALGLGMAMYFGGSLLLGNQKMPKIDMPDMSSSAFEGGYGWNTDNIRVRAGSPIPITFGSIRTSGQLLGRRLITKKVNDKQVQYLYLLLGANDGELDSITDIKINDNDLFTIYNADCDVRLGDNYPSAVTGYISEVAEQQTFSNELPLDTTNWVNKTQTVAGEKIELQFVCPQGIYYVDTGNGAQGAIKFTLKIQYREVGASTWIDYYADGFKEVATVNQRRPFYWKETLTAPDPAKTYEFRAQNYTLKNYNDNYWHAAYTEPPSNCVFNSNWISLTVLTDDKQIYPNTAVVALGIPASENLSGSLPKVSWVQTRSKVLVWDGSAYVEKDATNFAWIIYDLIHDCRKLHNVQTNSDEYVVFGEPKEKLDYTSFNNFATFCATETDGVPIAKGNLLVDSPNKMWTTIQKIASSARAFIIQQAGIFRPVWDRATTMTQIFTSGNIVDGSLKGSFLPARERASAIEASFINEENKYSKDTMLVTIDGYNPASLDNPTQIFFPGLTNSKVVYRAAKFMLRKNKYLKRVAKWSADIDSIVAQVGDVVGIQSDICNWGVGGRILGATTTQVVVDQDISLKAGNTYSILVRLGDDSLVRKTLDEVLADVTTDTLNFTSDPFDTAPSRYDLFAFGISQLETKPFTITRISRNGDLQANLEGIEYIADIYTTDSDFPVINYTEVGASINSLTVNPDADTGKLGVSWVVPSDKDYSSAIVFVDGKPQGFLTSEKTNIIIDSTPGSHTVSVLPIDGNGKAGTKATSTVTLGEATLNPVANVTLNNNVEQQSDGTSIVYIDGTYTVPGLATSVVVEIGEGSAPTTWTKVDDSTTGKVHILAKPAQQYTVRFTARNKYAVADSVSATITTAGDTTAPGIPTITASANFKTVTIKVSLSTVPADLAGFRIFRSTTANSADSMAIGSVSSKDGSATFVSKESTYGSIFYYFAKAFDTWGNLSGFSAASAQITILSIQGSDIVDGALNRSDLFVSGVVDATAIANAAVTEAKIATSAVTNSKIGSLAVDAAKIANNAVTASKTSLTSINSSTGDLNANTVNALQIVTNAVTSDKIIANAITAAKIATNAVEADKIKALAVTADKLAANSVVADKIAANAVTSDKIIANAVTTAKLAAGSVTAEKMLIGKAGAALNPDPCFQDSGEIIVFNAQPPKIISIGDGQAGDKTLTNYNTGNTANHYMTNTFIPVDTTKQYRVSALIRKLASGDSGHSYIGLYEYDSNFTRIATNLYYVYSFDVSTSWERYATIISPSQFNSATRFVRVSVILGYQATTGSVQAQDLRLEEVLPATLIQDGIITTAKINTIGLDAAVIKFGTMNGDRIEVGTLKADRLDTDFVEVGGAASDVNGGSATITPSKVTGTALITAGAAADINAHTTTISGGKITTGSISAGQVDATITKTTELQVYGKNICCDPAFSAVPRGQSTVNQTGNKLGSWTFGGNSHIYAFHKQEAPNIVGGAFENGSNGIQLNGSSTTSSSMYSDFFKVLPKVDYTLSVYIAVTGWATRITHYYIRWMGPSNNIVATSYLYSNYNIAPKAGYRDSFNVTAPDGAVYAFISFAIDSFQSGTDDTSGAAQVYLSAFQLEEGNSATAWVNREQGTISADKVVAGSMQSNNYSATAGSKYDLNAGVISLGGSSSPKFSVNAAGEMTSTAGQIAGISINSNGLYNTTGELSGSIYSTVGMFPMAVDSPVNLFDMRSAGFRALAYTAGPYFHSSVTIACSNEFDGGTPSDAHIVVTANAYNRYAFYTNGVVRAYQFQQTSDLGKKEDLIPTSGALNAVKDINVWSYVPTDTSKNAPNDQKRFWGILAQDFVKHFRTLSDGTYVSSVDFVLWRALQEYIAEQEEKDAKLNKTINALVERIEALEAKQ